MTWGEIKKAIELKGVKDEDIVAYIDIDDIVDLNVTRDGNGELEIWNL